MQGSTQWERSHRSLAVRPLGVPPAVIWLCAGAVLMLMSVPRLGAQDPLASARSLYASAAYDEALKKGVSPDAALEKLLKGNTAKSVSAR